MPWPDFDRDADAPALRRIASSTRSAPRPVISPVSSGWFHESITKLIAARLYTSSGCTFCMTFISDAWSSRSPSTMWMSGSVRSSIGRLGFAWPRIRPYTSYPCFSRCSER